jgi:5-methylcytosine-specific restriction endonuclease McrA
MKWPPKFQLLKENRRDVKGRRHKFEYQCAECKRWWMQKEIAVDHIEPAGALNCHEDLAGFVKRLFVGTDRLQLLCKRCHSVKTKEERNG